MKNFGIFFLILFILQPIQTKGQTASLEYKGLVNDTILPISIEQIENRQFISFNKTYFGKLYLQLNSPKKDTILVIIGERKTENKAVDTKPPGTVRFLSDTLFVDKGTHAYLINIPDFKPPGWAKNRQYNIPLPDKIGNIIPFRYVDVIDFDKKLEPENVRQIAYFYPFNDAASACQTSSDELNQIWQLCKHSIKATSFCGIYVDGDRERRPYEADAYINQLSHYAVDAEYAMARRTIDHLALYPTWPTEWLFHMPMMLWEDYMYTGNKCYLEKYYNHFKRLILDLPVHNNGLIINHNNNDIIDWPKSERDNYQLGQINNVPNAFYYNSLMLLSKISDVLGYEKERTELFEMAEKIKHAFNLAFWNESTGLFVDAIDNTHSSLHANIFPVVFGLADQNQINKIIPFVKSKGMATSVYAAQYLLDMLYLVNESDYAFDLLTAHNDRSWMGMIEQGSTITMEAWSEQVKPNLDWNHAWGAAPGNVIARRIFGIRPLMPGFKTALIEPKFSGLTSGTIKIPTINGNIEFSFKKVKKDILFVTIKADMPIQFKLTQEYTKAKSIKLNNVLIKPEFEDNQFSIQLDKRENTIEVEM